jgi:hypothetical protein
MWRKMVDGRMEKKKSNTSNINIRESRVNWRSGGRKIREINEA